MRRTNSDAIAVSASVARHATVRTDTPAVRTNGVSPRTVPVAGVPPQPVTGTVSSRTVDRAVRWVAAHGHLSVVAVLVTVTSLATALVVAHGARQLDISPQRATTPYLASPPKGPVEVPATSSTSAAPEGTGPQPGVRRSEARYGGDRRHSTDRGRDPGRKPEAAPQPPASRPPEASPPPREPEPSKPGSEERCRIGLRLLGHCVLGSPRHRPSSPDL